MLVPILFSKCNQLVNGFSPPVEQADPPQQCLGSRQGFHPSVNSVFRLFSEIKFSKKM